jgi:hypothetical protein
MLHEALSEALQCIRHDMQRDLPTPAASQSDTEDHAVRRQQSRTSACSPCPLLRGQAASGASSPVRQLGRWAPCRCCSCVLSVTCATRPMHSVAPLAPCRRCLCVLSASRGESCLPKPTVLWVRCRWCIYVLSV